MMLECYFSVFGITFIITGDLLNEATNTLERVSKGFSELASRRK
jgi:hypothetical protein